MKTTKATKTEATIVESGRVVGWTHTALRNGARVSYGRTLPGGQLHEHGRGTISRDKRNLQLISAAFDPDCGLEHYDVNQGGGPAV